MTLITSGRLGIGSWIAEGFVRGGGKVYIIGIREKNLQGVVEKLNDSALRKALNHVSDVTIGEDIKQLVRFVDKREDSRGVLVNDASNYLLGPRIPHEATL
ncbi:hypothetical protein BDQ12DRAFT_670526 [Crucibulum laeve]|uniref:Uncharacterized protein n=1 Tax=Crucibulum laeve TaxID=68775 RepID=A0A5C3LWH1_9AGAR|nr:hypothetical protein BDQ12DRAFT_670526 [Crucibulum laeve]